MTITTPGSSASRRTWWPVCGSGYDMPKTIIANGYAGELAVPLWGRFMAAATRADAPDRFTHAGNRSCP